VVAGLCVLLLICETQAGLITLAAKAALEIQKQISKSTQSPATTGGVSGLKKVPGV
jgi:hypothetical protein